MKRKYGILLPIYSLPDKYGIGTVGKNAYRFIDFLKEAKASLWQILPIGPTGYGNSPYQSFSSFAGNEYYIDLEVLSDSGFIDKNSIETLVDDSQYIDYGKLFNTRSFILDKAAVSINNSSKSSVFLNFIDRSSCWLDDYALFMALKRKFNMAPWYEWPDPYKNRHKQVIEEFKEKNRDIIEAYYYKQFFFDQQWSALKKYANSNGIELIGDVPIYVSLDSVDVWSNKELFELDEQGYPREVAGVPPDYFSETGQLWGNPIYRWNNKEDVYKWWGNRIRVCSDRFDYLRIDHFRGFESYWSIPFGEDTAINGRWNKGPGLKFVECLINSAGNMKLIAEDLGIITDEVRQLLRSSRLPGMKVLQFGFGSDENNENLPEHFVINSVAYSGTHDNPPINEWLETLSKNEAVFFRSYMEKKGLKPNADGLIRLGMGSRSKFFILQMQDVLGLGKGSRTNTPGTSDNNWAWKLRTRDNYSKYASQLAKLAEEYSRA